jgi:hypothetical protein
MAEQLTLNQLVLGSNPRGSTQPVRIVRWLRSVNSSVPGGTFLVTRLATEQSDPG